MCPIGKTNFRSDNTTFGILTDERRRHMYIVGKTGMGKSTLLENMMYTDVARGHGIAIIDPHGDVSEHILSIVPKERTNDVVIFDPSDTEFPIALNIFDHDSNPSAAASGILSIFKKLFAHSW